jgi:hypothetical protein
MLYNIGMLRKGTIAGIVALLMATSAHASRCVKVVLPNADPEWNCHTPEHRCELLNVREKPNTKSKILLKLDPGDVVRLDDDPTLDLFKKWKRIQMVAHPDIDVYGWIYIKYTKPTDCVNPKSIPYVEPEEPPTAPPTGGFEPVPPGTWILKEPKK